jgi:C-terminal processing protease CtpA/Prc
MDFTGNDNFNLDRSKAPWPKDEAELNALWDAKVKFDQLSLKLAGKDDKEIRDTLTRRYKFAIRRLAQTNSEDVFSLAMTAFAREIDPHTNYLSPRNTEQFNTEMSLSLEGSARCCRWMMTTRSSIRWWPAVRPRRAKRSASAIASLALARPGSRWLMSSAGVWMTSWR